MKEYLPLGSIVVLKGGRKKLMIYGRRQVQRDTGNIFDYVACLYPEGNLSEEFTYLFNHETVETIIHRGYTDLEEERVLEMLNQDSSLIKEEN